ncbi:MAG TPA: EmrB/QacA family drug resistance transporter, partial [Rhodospirillaceae bacterium]|nr:EmrB/QacA family drug resistance transporter [Rhodospirillaceae bacterium]
MSDRDDSKDPEDEDESPLTPRERIAVVVGILPAGMITGMDTFAVGVALPRMQGVLSATLVEISWILTAYLVASTVFTPMYGWLARRIGRRRLFVTIIVGFCACATLIAQSDSLEEIIFFRFCQGFFGAGFNPLLMQVVLATFPVRQQGIAFGWLTTGRMSGIIVGPLLGGIMTEYFSWRFVFLTNLPLGLFAAYLILRYVPKGHPESTKKFDIFGFLVLGVSILALQYVLDQGQTLGWFDSLKIAVAAGIAAATFYVFCGHMFLSRNPFINPRVFFNREFAIGLIFGFLLNFMVFGYAGLIPPILQNHMGYPVISTGLLMVPRGIGTMVASLVAGAMLLHWSARPVAVIGIVCIGASTWWLSFFTPNSDAISISLALFMQGSGFGFLSVSLTTVAFQSMSPALRADGTSVLSLFRRLGSSIGVSVLVTQLARSTQSARQVLGENYTQHNELFKHLPLPDKWTLESLPGMLSMEKVIDKQAEFIAYLHD